MARADLHVHTAFSAWRHLRFIHPRDSYVQPLEAYRAALAAGMDFVAITDHDEVEGALRLLECPGVEPERIIVGEEVECRFPDTRQWVHVNVLGISEEDHRALQRLKGDVRDLCAFCRERGLLHALNHPFQSFSGQKSPQAYVEDILSLFTHVEGLNGAVSALQNRAATVLGQAAWERGLKLTPVAGSDAHTARRIGASYTEAQADTPAGFLEEIRQGRCAVGGATGSLWSLVADVHAIIGEYYLRLYTGRGEGRGPGAYAADLLCATAMLPFAFGPFPAAVTALSFSRQGRASRAVIASLTAGRGAGSWKAAFGLGDSGIRPIRHPHVAVRNWVAGREVPRERKWGDEAPVAESRVLPFPGAGPQGPRGDLRDLAAPGAALTVVRDAGE